MRRGFTLLEVILAVTITLNRYTDDPDVRQEIERILVRAVIVLDVETEAAIDGQALEIPLFGIIGHVTPSAFKQFIIIGDIEYFTHIGRCLRNLDIRVFATGVFAQ